MVVLLFLSAVPMWGYQIKTVESENGQHKEASSLKGKETQKSEPTPPTVVQPQTANAEVGKQDRQSQESESAAHSHDWIDKLNAFSTTVIAVFTILLFFGVIWQISTSRDTERAWVIDRITTPAPPIGFIQQQPTNLVAHLVGYGAQNVFRFALENTGNTPARLVEVVTNYRKINRRQDIPQEPDYGTGTFLNDMPLSPEASEHYMTFLEPDIILNWEDFQAVSQQAAFLYAFGRVIYRDVYSRLHETRFGCVYHIPLGGDPRERGFRREWMPPAYNKAT